MPRLVQIETWIFGIIHCKSTRWGKEKTKFGQKTLTLPFKKAKKEDICTLFCHDGTIAFL